MILSVFQLFRAGVRSWLPGPPAVPGVFIYLIIISIIFKILSSVFYHKILSTVDHLLDNICRVSTFCLLLLLLQHFGITAINRIYKERKPGVDLLLKLMLLCVGRHTMEIHIIQNMRAHKKISFSGIPEVGEKQ